MGKQYEGNVEIYANHETKKVNIRPNPKGGYNKENVSELYKTMKKHSDKLGHKMNIYVPDASKAEQPLLLTSYQFGGKPYLAMLEKRDTNSSVGKKKSSIRVLA